jgi:hypothetical protein
MLLEGVQLYIKLKCNLEIGLDWSPVPIFCLIAYGVPFLIVCISVSVNYYLLNGNGYGTMAQ